MRWRLTKDSHDNDEDEVDVLQDDKEIKVGVVVDTNAVVHPLAMMVEALDALVTDVTVARVSSADHFAVWTQQVSLKLLNQADEGNFGCTLHVAWLHLDRQSKENHGTQEDHKQNGEPSIGIDICRNKKL